MPANTVVISARSVAGRLNRDRHQGVLSWTHTSLLIQLQPGPHLLDFAFALLLSPKASLELRLCKIAVVIHVEQLELGEFAVVFSAVTRMSIAEIITCAETSEHEHSLEEIGDNHSIAIIRIALRWQHVWAGSVSRVDAPAGAALSQMALTAWCFWAVFPSLSAISYLAPQAQSILAPLPVLQ
jgi:hypothetical protein